MKSNNALIILWQGNELPDNDVRIVAKVLVNRGCIESINDVTIVKKDENAIAKSLLATAATETSFVVDGFKRDVRNEVESAIVYIGERFEDSLKGTNTTTGLIAFAMNLTAAVTSARNSIDKSQHDYALLNAIEIIKKNCNAINTSASLAKQYRFTNKVVEVICQTYKGLYMAHRKPYMTGKTIRFKTENPKHADATPYKRPKYKIDYRDYDN